MRCIPPPIDRTRTSRSSPQRRLRLACDGHPRGNANFSGTYSAVVSVAPAANTAHTTKPEIEQTIADHNLAILDVAQGGEASASAGELSVSAPARLPTSTPGLAGSVARYD